MSKSQETIEILAAGLKPVRRLAPPARRAGAWLAAVTAVSAAAVVWFAKPQTLWLRLAEPALAIELAATLVTGVAAVLAAFYVSLPDRSRVWALLPMAPLAVWLAASGSQCWQALAAFGAEGWARDSEPACFIFIVAVGVPLTVSLLVVLRRAAPLEPVRTALLGALGAGALCAFVLQFFHPFDVTFLDLGFHAAAVGVLLLIASLLAHLSRSREA